MDRKVEFYAYNRTAYKVVTNIKVNLNVRAILERKWKNLVTEWMCTYVVKWGGEEIGDEEKGAKDL